MTADLREYDAITPQENTKWRIDCRSKVLLDVWAEIALDDPIGRKLLTDHEKNEVFEIEMRMSGRDELKLEFKVSAYAILDVCLFSILEDRIAFVSDIRVRADGDIP